MKKMISFAIIIIIIIMLGTGMLHVGAGTVTSCHSPAYLEYGQNDIIRCNFPSNFESVFWYKNSDQGPFISYENELTVGPGFDSGKFVITPDGSLLIYNVNLEHEKRVRVFVHYEGWEDDIRQEIDVIVFIRPNPPFPHIDVCEGRSNCLIVLDELTELKCSVNETRPEINLVWSKQSGNEIVTLPSREMKYTIGHKTSTITSTNVAFANNHVLEVITCRTSDNAPWLNLSQSSVLIEENVNNFTSMLPSEIYAKPKEKLTLDVDHEVYAAVWKKLEATGQYRTIGYIVNGVSELFGSFFEITRVGALEIKNFQVKDEGEYLCVYATAKRHTSKRFQAYYFIAPNPPYPKIFGCSDKNNCQLNVSSRGHLTCSLEGIRPLVHLEWIFIGEGASPITFSSPVLHVANRGDSYDSSVTTSFAIEPGTLEQNIHVACEVVDKMEAAIFLKSNVTLHYFHVPMDNGNRKLYRTGLAFLIIGASLTFVFCACFCFVIYAVISERKKEEKKKKQNLRKNRRSF